MKKIKILLVLSLFAIACFTSCTDLEEDLNELENAEQQALVRKRPGRTTFAE